MTTQPQTTPTPDAPLHALGTDPVLDALWNTLQWRELTGDGARFRDRECATAIRRREAAEAARAKYEAAVEARAIVVYERLSCGEAA